jgi:predicted ribosome quality control (RQC) complex YloA/Tae2 family protein
LIIQSCDGRGSRDRSASTPRHRDADEPTAMVKQREIPPRPPPKRYRSADGLEIWVGRDDDSNDYLTTTLACASDLFVHVEGAPGSHVVLRTEGRRDPPAESLLDACELAVHFSKQRRAQRVDVHVAALKDVRKPAGAKPGLVVVRRGRTVRLRRDPQRLERLLASRIKDSDNTREGQDDRNT